MAQLLLTGIRFRKDTQTEISLLTTIVSNPDEDDEKNLRSLPGYLKQTIKFPMILHSDGANVIKWWADASYADHGEMWGHTGGTMAMGKNGRGLIISISKKT